ncbi:hypothetical protein ACIQV3_28305 [Streptomyces sp. NPDC099050]|uniref:hypothetical protein n=1 Tax=Streptomyces sp. NPDC099050 TaxID=3366100 RepID=UPI00380AA870
MTDTTSAPKSDARAGEAEWMMPVLVLIPVSLVRQFTGHTTPWLVMSWICCALAAVLLVAGWGTVRSHGMRNAWGWVTCGLAHSVFAGQVGWLILR